MPTNQKTNHILCMYTNLDLHKIVFGWIISGYYVGDLLNYRGNVSAKSLFWSFSCTYTKHLGSRLYRSWWKSKQWNKRWRLLLLQKFDETLSYNSEWPFYKGKPPRKNEFSFQRLLNNEAIARDILGILIKKSLAKLQTWRHFTDQGGSRHNCGSAFWCGGKGHRIFHLPKQNWKNI